MNSYIELYNLTATLAYCKIYMSIPDLSYIFEDGSYLV